jgi:hypothetical protein
MITLNEILNEVRSSKKPFETQKINVDSETGAVTWNVKYNFNIKDVYEDLNKAVSGLAKLIENNPDDPRLVALFQEAKNLRNRMSRIISSPA